MPFWAPCSCQAARAEASKGLKERLFARYDQQNLNVTHEGLRVTVLNGTGGSIPHYAINYDHFCPAIQKSEWPKNYLKRNLVDEFTTEEIGSGAQFTDALSFGEMVRTRLFYVEVEKDYVRVDLYLIALDGRRVARMQTNYGDGGAGLPQSVNFGFHFRFYILPPASDPSEDGYFNQITKVIGRYLVPTEEYLQQNKAAAAVEACKARTDVNIQPGMSKADVVQILCEPLKTVTFGDKMYLKYADLTIELQNGKVVDVKTN